MYLFSHLFGYRVPYVHRIIQPVQNIDQLKFSSPIKLVTVILLIIVIINADQHFRREMITTSSKS